MKMEGVKILQVPVVLLGQLWRRVAPWLVRGLAESPNVTLDRLVDDLLAGTDTLWTIFVDGKLSGVFVTHVFTDDRGKAVDVYALCGVGLLKWSKALSRAMVQHAKDEGCSRIIFCSRKGAERAYEGFRVVGELRPGVLQFERVIE